LTFLKGNDVKLPVDEALIYDAMIAIAEKRMTKSDLAAIFQKQASDL